jgi:hypothetical protein
MSISAMKQALEALEKLWDIIDDIDTYGDMAKSDDKLYRSLVERRQRQRFEQTGISTDGYELNGGAITALRQAIAEAEKQEPVAQCSYPKCQATNGCVGACSKTAPVHAIDISQERVDETAKHEHEFFCPRCGHCCQQREWVGLTDGDIAQTMHGSVEGSNMLPYQFAKAIEAKLKEKNT